MKLNIQGVDYPAVKPETAQLIHLMELVQQTGIGNKQLQRMAEAYTRKEDDTPDELFMGVMVFLSRRQAGEKLTFEEACAFPLSELKVILEEGDKLPEPAVSRETATETGVKLPDPTTAGRGVAAPKPAKKAPARRKAKSAA